MTSISPDNSKNADFVKFLLSEYDNIAQAHFKTIDTISEFYKHYLTIVTIPITIVAIALNLDFVQESLDKIADTGLFSGAALVLAIVFIIISIIGFTVLWYILNLRWDALLYARTVNGIRKYFYDADSQLDVLTKSRIRALPQSISMPEYKEFWFFGPVVIAFAIVDSLYLYVGLLGIWFSFGNPEPFINPWVLSITLIIFIFHFCFYVWLANYREYGKSRFAIFGADIDGVLNQNKDQFARFYKEKTGKSIDPHQMKTIPLRECERLGVTREEEFEVFNDPDFWITHQVAPDAARVLLSLKNSSNMKIHLFTSRPWPIQDTLGEKEFEKLQTDWKIRADNQVKELKKERSWKMKIIHAIRPVTHFLPYRRYTWRKLFRQGALEKITRVWLEKEGVVYDRLMVEEGSEDVADPSSHKHNRFFAARTGPIKYFVEDDLRKAKKLSYICDMVFLIDHPYNQSSDLPGNIIRVKSWDELLQRMREIY